MGCQVSKGGIQNLPKIQNTQRKISCQKVQKYDFENQFSMSKYGLNHSKRIL